MNYGYARISTDHQSLGAQIEVLTAAGCGKVFQEKARGTRGDRTALKRAINQLSQGNVLIVTRLNLLARSTHDLLNVLDEITCHRAGFCALVDAWADTTTSYGRLLVTMLGGMAEFERDLIRTRTSQHLKRARVRGVTPGTKPKLSHFQKQQALAQREAGENCAEVERSYNVSYSTILRLKYFEGAVW